MLDIALEREVEGDLMLDDTGQGIGLRLGILDGAISISSVQICLSPLLAKERVKMERVVLMKTVVRMKKTRQFAYLTGADLEKKQKGKLERQRGMRFLEIANTPQVKERIGFDPLVRCIQVDLFCFEHTLYSCVKNYDQLTEVRSKNILRQTFLRFFTFFFQFEVAIG